MSKVDWAGKRDEFLQILRTSATRDELVKRCCVLQRQTVSYDAVSRAYYRARVADTSLPPIDEYLGSDLEGEEYTIAEDDEKDQVDPREIEVGRLRRKLRDARATNKRFLKALDEAEERLETVLAIQDIDDSRAVKVVPKKPSKKKRNAVAVALASDWHVEETVDPDTVNGRNEYNPDIAEKRAANYFEAIAWTLEHNRHSFAIDTLNLALMGDLITGYIHEELEETNAMSPTEAILFCQRLIINGMDFLLKDCGVKQLVVPCVYGNHGRTTKKRRIKSGAKNSYEWMMYHQLNQHYRNDKRVEFHIANGAHLYTQIYDTTIRWHHGDDIRYYGGVSGLSLPLFKAIDKWDDFRHADVTCIGHYHQYWDFNKAVCNGSLIGYSPYALHVKAEYQEPKQAFFLVDEKRGRLAASALYVE